MRVAFAPSGTSPFCNGAGMTGGEMSSAPSVTPDFSMSSLVLFEGVECLLVPSVNLLAVGTGRGALLDPPTPDVDDFLGLFFFLFASNTALLVLEIFKHNAVNFLAVQCWLRLYLVKSFVRSNRLASSLTF